MSDKKVHKINLGQIKDLRAERNAEILQKMHDGEPLSSFSSAASWFPPRPIISKDGEAVKSLYGGEVDSRLVNSALKDDQERKNVVKTPPLKLV
ncbi:MAG: hypothetical protein CMP10_08745 [Zetaproteobacteria bacterium]|nr:hypothetical protein [Pseudobdellovibrionaceae bacterium]